MTAIVRPGARAVPATIEFIIDGGGGPITTGVKGDIEMPFSGTITSARLLAGATGSIVIDIWKDAYARFPPTVLDSICGASKPTIAADDQYEDEALTGWDTLFSAGDVFRINVDSSADLGRVTLSLTCLKA